MQTRPDEETRPRLPEGHDVLAAIHLLEWARERGFALGNVQVGAVKFQVVDIRQAKLEGASPQQWAELTVEQAYGAGDAIPAEGTTG